MQCWTITQHKTLTNTIEHNKHLHNYFKPCACLYVAPLAANPFTKRSPGCPDMQTASHTISQWRKNRLSHQLWAKPKVHPRYTHKVTTNVYFRDPLIRHHAYKHACTRQIKVMDHATPRPNQHLSPKASERSNYHPSLQTLHRQPIPIIDRY